MRTNYGAHDARYQQLRAKGADGWDDDAPRQELELAWALERIESRGGRLLELGCGAGNNARFLVERGFDVTGIDISPTAIEWATSRGVPRTQFVVGDLVQGIAGTYDVVIDGHCLHCIIGADRARFLANVRGALAPGGQLFISTMCGEVTLPALVACFDPRTRCQVIDGVAYRYIGDADGLLEELRAAGFSIVCSTVRSRESADDQDHLWAIAISGA